MAKTILEVSHLSKRFGDFTAVDDISFFVQEGEIVGLLGPNGAGKTTTIQMLLGLITQTAGTIQYFGKNFASNREYCLSRINFTSAYTHLQGRLTVRQNLIIYAGLYGVKDPLNRIKKLGTLLHIEAYLDELFWHLSSGEKTRVNLVKALLNSPSLILMDEPTASLDPEIMNMIIDLIYNLAKKEGVGVFYTSHNMEEVARVCSRVIFLDHGRIVVEDTPLGLTKRVGKAQLIITFDGENKPVSKYLGEKGYQYKYPRYHVVQINLPEEDIPKVLFGLSNVGVWLTDIDVKKPDLEDVFLSIAAGKSYEFRKN